MVWSTDTYTNDVAPTADQVALNALVAEQASLVTPTGQTPNQAITDQMGKGAAILASGAIDQYTISGGPGAYIATPIAPVTPISPGALFTGLRVRGVFNVTNTGGAMTINVNGIGATPVKLVDGTDPIAGDLPATQQIEMFHDGVNFVVTTEVASIVLGLVPPASQAEMEAALLNNVFVTPLNFLNSPFAAKAWILFDGDPAAPVILDSQGIASLIRIGGNGSGEYHIDLTVPFSSINYIPVGMCGGPLFTTFTLGFAIQDANTLGVQTSTAAGVAADASEIAVAFFGDQ